MQSVYERLTENKLTALDEHMQINIVYDFTTNLRLRTRQHANAG